MDDQWEARVIFSPGRVANNVYLSRSRRGTGGVREFLTPGNIAKTVTPDKQYADDELIFATLDDDQLHALQMAITNYGIKPPEASYVQGKLEAATEHLADMRKLVFEPGIIKVVQKGELK